MVNEKADNVNVQMKLRQELTISVIANRKHLSVRGCLALLAVVWSTSLHAQSSPGMVEIQKLEFAIKTNSEQGQRAFVAVAVENGDVQKEPARNIFRNLLTPQSGRLPLSFGGGVIIEKGGDSVKILTLAHLLFPVVNPQEGKPSPQILVRFFSQETAIATIVALDPRSDLAVIEVAKEQIPNIFPKVDAVRLSESVVLHKGTFLYAIGNPFALARKSSPSVHLALISNTNREQNSQQSLPAIEKNLHTLGTLLELSLLSPEEASGTILFNLKGELTGILTSVAAPGDGNTNSTYAIPMNAGFKRIVSELKQGYEVNYGFLGISPETTVQKAFNQVSPDRSETSVVIVSRVAKNSPAEHAGIHREDFILEVDDVPISTSEDLIREIGMFAPGETVNLVVYRLNEGKKVLPVTIGKWPIYDDSLLVTTQRRFPLWRGLAVDYPTGRRRYLRDRFLSEFPQGVVVSYIEPNSSAEKAGLRVGQFISDVNGNLIHSPDEFQKQVAMHEEGRLTLLDGTQILVEKSTE